MSRLLELARTEPAAVTAIVQALIGLVVQFGFTLTAAETGSLLAATTAGLAVIAAAATRPFQVSALTGLLTALGTLLLAFGVPHVQAGMVTAVNAVVVGAFAFLGTRPQVTPVAKLHRPVPVPPGPVPPAAA